jgi:DNA-damage-inducible protein D
MTELSVFHFDDNRPNFEGMAHPNGGTYWFEAELQRAMDYQDASAFRKVVMKAMQACLSLSILTEDNFVRLNDGSYKLTRFACYLIAMNGDSKKAQVAAAQLYLAALAETYATHREHANGIDRLLIRDEVTDGEKYLASTAKAHEVANYAFFKDAGYRGMYNMSLKQLKIYKRIGENEIVIDRMGKEELAAHLFRITQTAARIDADNVRGQRSLESAATLVGQRVRKAMIEISGKPPEKLPAAEPLAQVKKTIKNTNRNLKRIDESPSQ